MPHIDSVDTPLPTDGRGLFTRLIIRLLMLAERLNIRYSKVGNPPVYDTALFPWVSHIESAYPEIKTELLQVLKRKEELGNFQDLVPGVKNISTDDHWKSLLFMGYGVSVPKNIAHCPNTWAALQRIPSLQTAMFSIFDPGKHLPPHRGPFNGVLRLHLGLIVPEGDTAIRVDTEVVTWKEGKVAIFDDSFEHEAWNHTDSVRVVLFVDFERPVRFPARLLNKLIFNVAAFTPFIREAKEAEQKWEKVFYKTK